MTDVLDLEGTNVVVVKDSAPRDPTAYVQVDFGDNPFGTAWRAGMRALQGLPADSVIRVDTIDWLIPSAADPGVYRVDMRVSAPDGASLSRNASNITVR